MAARSSKSGRKRGRLGTAGLVVLWIVLLAALGIGGWVAVGIFGSFASEMSDLDGR
ncbi:MAG: hypothetical protein SFZ24_00665 [Planctomycetota bacterium]|nr:hypothetical protein [Planctomycetota bacterium]